MQKVVLIITDGIGYKEKKDYNAFYHAKKPTYDYLFKNVAHSFIATYGNEVGLPDGVMGNSEVGHMSIGSGKVLYQDLVKINNAIAKDELKDNEVLQNTIKNSQRINLAILMSDGGVHSHLSHLFGFLKVIENMRSKKPIFLHLITDGRDVPPNTATKYLSNVIDFIKDYDNVKIATISGRFYAMDRDNRWERIEQYYKTLMGENRTTLSPMEYISQSFKDEIFDEFINPVSFDFDGLKDKDGFIFLNYRSDRAREIMRALSVDNFSEFNRAKKDLFLACNCQYDESLNLPVIFPKDKLKNTLSEIISNNNLRQAHIAETEKYAHVTFFFNGGREEAFKNEDRFLVPSPKVKTYDLKPEMSAIEVCDNVIKCMEKEYDFIVVNFANGDMVGHTGNYDACIKAVECIDAQLGRILQKSNELDYALVITSDHGNCEDMKDENLNVLTNHTVGDVFCFIKARGVSKIDNGRLSNIAPSVLKIMNLHSNEDMDRALF